jgi:hypothetical protein
MQFETAEVQAAPPNGAARMDSAEVPAAVDLSTWLSQSEVCQILGISPRSLNEMIERGKGPEKRFRPVEGRRPEPRYHPGDVERIRAKREPKPPVFSAASGVGPRQETAIAAAPPVLELLERLADRAIGLVERRPPDLGPWMPIAAAAKEYGIPPSTLRHVAWQKLLLKDPAVYKPLHGGLRIRRGAVAAIDARELHAADEVRPRRRAPAKRSVLGHQAADQAAPARGAVV